MLSGASSFGWYLNSLRPRQNDRHFTDGIFKFLLMNENIWISPKILLKFVPMVSMSNIPVLIQIMAWRRPGDKPLCESIVFSLLKHYMRHLNNIPTLIQIMAWRRPGDKPLSESMVVSLLTHLCVTWLLRVKQQNLHEASGLTYIDCNYTSTCPHSSLIKYVLNSFGATYGFSANWNNIWVQYAYITSLTSVKW